MYSKKCYQFIILLVVYHLKLAKCDFEAFVTHFFPSVIDRTDYQGQTLPSVFFCGIDNKDNVIDHTWLVRLKYENDQYGCGGVLLNSRYILTAASCVTGDIVSVLGELRGVTLIENSDNRLTTDYEIEQIVRHSNFIPNNVHGQNDAALLRLARIVPRERSTPICIDVFDAIDEANDPYVEGWGQSFAGQQSAIRQSLRIKYVNVTACQDLLHVHNYELASSDICTSLHEGDYQTPCPVDGGGVLLKKLRSKWWLVGLGSYNAVCGYNEFPGVFTRITKIHRWITLNLKP